MGEVWEENIRYLGKVETQNFMSVPGFKIMLSLHIYVRYHRS
jgi:hypothetical protein